MPSVQLDPGEVDLRSVPTPSGLGSIVGAAPQWSDGSDATYAVVGMVDGAGRDIAYAQIPQLSVSPETVTGITMEVRFSLTGTLPDMPVAFEISSESNGDGFLGSFSGNTAQDDDELYSTDGEIRTVVRELDTEAWSGFPLSWMTEGLAAQPCWIQIGPYVPTGESATVTVYGVSLAVTHTASAPTGPVSTPRAIITTVGTEARPQRRGWRYFATRLNGDGTETLLNADLPIEDVSIEDVLSGTGAITGTISPAYSNLMADDGEPLFQEWSTAVYAEQNGAIRAGAIFTDSDFDGPEWQIEATGFTGYARDMPYIGTGYKGIQVDPIDVVRVIWDHLQSKRGGNLGLTLAGTTTGGAIKIGTVLKQVEFDTQSGPISFESGPYKLNEYSSHDLGQCIDDLANETPFDYHERHYWNGEEIVHRLDIGYPKIGKRRTDLRFVYGVNVFDPVKLKRDGGLYASGTLVLGAGDGASAIRAVSEPPNRPGGRLRRIAVVQDDTIKSKTRATKRAAAENQWRSRLDDVESILVQDHPNAQLGAVHVGDEIRIEGKGDWIGVDMWVRVLGITYQPANGNVAEYRIARTDRLMS